MSGSPGQNGWRAARGGGSPRHTPASARARGPSSPPNRSIRSQERGTNRRSPSRDLYEHSEYDSDGDWSDDEAGGPTLFGSLLRTAMAAASVVAVAVLVRLERTVLTSTRLG